MGRTLAVVASLASAQPPELCVVAAARVQPTDVVWCRAAGAVLGSRTLRPVKSECHRPWILTGGYPRTRIGIEAATNR
jgi:hypothetical protein